MRAGLRRLCDRYATGRVRSFRPKVKLDGREGRREVVGARLDRLGNRDAQFAIAIKNRLSAQDG